MRNTGSSEDDAQFQEVMKSSSDKRIIPTNNFYINEKYYFTENWCDRFYIIIV